MTEASEGEERDAARAAGENKLLEEGRKLLEAAKATMAEVDEALARGQALLASEADGPLPTPSERG